MEIGKVVEVTAGIKVSSRTEGKLTVEAKGWKLKKIEIGVRGLFFLTFEKEKRKK